MVLMNQKDTISSKEGTVFITVNGRNQELAELIELEATVKLEKTDVKVIGQRMTGSKVTGATGTGKIKMYFQNPTLRNMVLDYLENGKIPDIEIKYENYDPTSSAGRNAGVLTGVVFDQTTLTKLSADNGVLEEEADFTFSGVKSLDSFVKR